MWEVLVNNTIIPAEILLLKGTDTPMSFETIYDRLMSGEESLALIWLGYVGMPIAVEFAKHVKVIDFNHNEKRIQQYKSGIDPTHEVGDEAISKTTVDFTSDETRLREARFLVTISPMRQRS